MSVRIINESTLGIVDKLKERSKWTPDFSKLRWFPEIPIFVYDSLRIGGNDNETFLNGSKFSGKAHSVTPHFSLNMRNDVPVCFHEPDECLFRAHVRGELFVVSVEHIHALDRSLLNGHRYERIPFKVFLEDINPKGAGRMNQTPWVNAFVYLGIRKYWNVKGLKRIGNVQHKNNIQLLGKDISEWNPLADPANLWGRTAPGHNNGMGTAVYPSYPYGDEFEMHNERMHIAHTVVDDFDDEDETLMTFNGYNMDRRRIM